MGRATGKNNKNLGPLDLLKGLYQTLGGAGKGIASATLGAPGDIEGLLRMLTPGVSNEPYLPNTEKVSKYMPGPTNTMSTLGENLPLTPNAIGKLGKPLARQAAGQIHRGMMGEGPLRGALQSVAPQFVVKGKGGNWLTDNVDEAIKPELRTKDIDRLRNDLPMYQPYIRDFLDSQEWGKVRDLKNAGMIDVHDRFPQYQAEAPKRFMTPLELEQLQADRSSRLKEQFKTPMSDAIDDPNFGAGWEPDDHIEFANGGLVEEPDYFHDLDAFLAR